MNSAISLSMHYRDAHQAIAWLCDVLGFARHAIYEGPQNTVMHAELTLGGGMVMLSSVNEGAYNRLMAHPDEIGMRGTHSVNVHVPDPDVVYERVLASGVDVVFPNEDKDYGGRGFTCRDAEGHLWNVGSYDPWAAK